MKSRTATLTAIVIGSFFVHCSQSMMGSMGEMLDGGARPKDLTGGAVKDAHADSGSCVTCDREMPTVLFDDVVKPEKVGAGCAMTTPVIDISAYRTVVVHSARCQTYVQVRNGKAGFVLATADTCNANTIPPHPLIVNSMAGRELRVNFGSPTNEYPDPGYACDTTEVAVTIVGYKNP